jgi:hypothetical protein
VVAPDWSVIISKEYVLLTVSSRIELAAIAICLDGPIGMGVCVPAGFSLWERILFFITEE